MDIAYENVTLLAEIGTWYIFNGLDQEYQLLFISLYI